MSTQRFEVPIRFDSFNQYADKLKKSRPQRHYFPARIYKKDVEEQIQWYIKARKIRPVKRPCIITFIWYESKKGRDKSRDKDNIAFAKKFILDGLQKARILPNDNDDWVVGFSDGFVYGAGQKVVVQIDEVDEVNYDERVGEKNPIT